MHGKIETPEKSGKPAAFARVLLVACFVILSRPAIAQVDLAGSWAARNHEFLTGDGLPVD